MIDRVWIDAPSQPRAIDACFGYELLCLLQEKVEVSASFLDSSVMLFFAGIFLLLMDLKDLRSDQWLLFLGVLPFSSLKFQSLGLPYRQSMKLVVAAIAA